MSLHFLPAGLTPGNQVYTLSTGLLEIPYINEI